MESGKAGCGWQGRRMFFLVIKKKTERTSTRLDKPTVVNTALAHM